MLERKKERAAAIQQSLLNGGAFYPLSFFDSRKYIQHNVKVGDGLGPIYAYMDALPRDRRSVRVCRAVEDGDFSFVHNDYRLGDLGAMAAFEVQRWEDDRIVEHWDNLQSSPDSANPSGRTMTDGATVVTDVEKTVENKALVEQYITQVLVGGRLTALDRFFAGDNLIQHNPTLGDGVVALRRSLESGGTQYDRLHKLIGEGNFVLAMCEGRSVNLGVEQPTAIFDLYRIANGRIVEHWDVVEIIPPRNEWANDNGKFGQITNGGIDDQKLRAQYGCASGPVATSSIIHTASDGLTVAQTAIDRGDVQMPIYAAKPQDQTNLPIVLVVCEAFGLNEHLRDIARRLAHQGYLAIAPDLMKRQGDPLAFDDFESLRRDLLLEIPDEQVMGDLDACVEWAQGFGGDRKRLAATGFCWGGRWIWLYAAQRTFAAAVAWYGLLDAKGSGVLPSNSPLFPVHPIDLAGKIRTPVLGLFGGRDPTIPVPTIDEMKDRLAQGSDAARRSQILTYPQASHAFFADYRGSYEPVAAADGWKRSLEWIGAALG